MTDIVTLRDKHGAITGWHLREDAYKKIMWFMNSYEAFRHRGLSRESGKILDDFVYDMNDINILYWFSAAIDCGDELGQSPPIADEVLKWMMGPLQEILKISKKSLLPQNIDPIAFGRFVIKVVDKTITPTMGKAVLARLFKGESLEQTLTDEAFKKVEENTIVPIIEKILTDNPAQLADYKSGNTKVKQWFIGQIMKTIRGKGDPSVIQQTLSDLLDKA